MSVKATPVSAAPVFGFVIVKESVVVPFNANVPAPNDLDIEGGAITVSVSDAVLPVPPFVDVTVTVLIFVPAVVPVTITVTVQLPLAEIDAPLKLTPGPFAAAVTVPPVQFVEALGVAAFCIPEG